MVWLTQQAFEAKARMKFEEKYPNVDAALEAYAKYYNKPERLFQKIQNFFASLQFFDYELMKITMPILWSKSISNHPAQLN